MILITATILVLTAQQPGAVPAASEKAEVPSKEDQAQILKDIKSLFKEDYAARDVESKAAFGRKLLQQAEDTVGDPKSRYVLFLEAHAMAVDGQDLETACEAALGIGRLYKTSAAGLLEDGIREYRKRARSREAVAATAEASLMLANLAVAEHDYALASKAARDARTYAKKADDKATVNAAERLSKEVPELKKEWDVVARAELALSVTPDDPELNLNYGRYVCFMEERWNSGLPMLLKSGVPLLKVAAERELAPPSDAVSRKEAGDAWWDAAEKERSPLHKRRYQDRARHWYEESLGELSGLAKTVVDRRLEELDKLNGVSGVVDLLAMIDAAQDNVVVGELLGRWEQRGRTVTSPAGKPAILKIPYEPPAEYDLKVLVNREQGEVAFAVGLRTEGKSVPVILDGFAEGFAHVSGVDRIEGKSYNNNETTKRGRIFADTKPHTVVYSVRKNMLTVRVDNRPIISWKADYSRITEGGEKAIRLGQPFFFTLNTSYKIHKAVLIPVRGRGRALR